MKHAVLFAIALLLVLFAAAIWPHYPVFHAQEPSGHACDASLWQHVYHGSRFEDAQDRLKVMVECTTVTGTLHFVRYEKDGDAHLRLDVDPQFKNLLNAKNALEKNMLVVETMCEKVPQQADTKSEKVCNGWHQDLYKSALNGRHVAVTGAYVLDEEHLWFELHPVTSIVVQ